MANKQRPIDAPAPPWRLMPSKDSSDEDSMEPTEVPPVDKAALAKQLADQAKAQIQAKKAADAEVKAGKADLAKRLVEQAKAAQAEKKAKDAELRKGKADLARELVEKAKRESSQGAEPRAAAPSTPAPSKPAPSPKAEEASLSDRAGNPKSKTLTAKEALAAAFAAEAAAEVAEPAPTPPPAPVVEPVAQVSHPGAVAALAALPRAKLVGLPIAITRVSVFTALWKAHRSKAQKAGDASFVAASSVLIHAVGTTALTAVRVDLDGTEWATFVDDKGKLLAAVQQPDTYLAGLS